jgi:hypothetical protein
LIKLIRLGKIGHKCGVSCDPGRFLSRLQYVRRGIEGQREERRPPFKLSLGLGARLANLKTVQAVPYIAILKLFANATVL